MNILIISDSDSLRLVLLRLLQHAGYSKLVCVESGHEALNYLKARAKNPEKSNVSLILLDFHIKNTASIKFTRMLQKNSLFATIPIIIITGEATHQTFEEAFAAGVVDFISKPIKEIELQARVSAALGLKQERDQRRLRERELQQILDAMPSQLVCLDRGGRITRVNESFKKVTGFRDKNLLGQNFLTLFPMWKERSVPDRAIRVLKTRIPLLGLEEYVEILVGFPRWFSIDILPDVDERGKLQGLQIFTQDITARKYAEKALRESEEQYRSLFNQLTISIMELDFSNTSSLLKELQKDGIYDVRAWLYQSPENLHKAVSRVRLSSANDMALSLFGARSKQSLAEHMNVLFTGIGKEIFVEQLVAIQEGSSRIELKAALATIKGTPINAIVKFFLLEQENMLHLSRMVLAILDITQIERAKEALEIAKDKAEEASRTKSTFLASISHEIRTPMTSILGFSDLILSQNNLDKNVRDGLQKIQHAGERLLDLINDVLDLSKIEAGKIELDENDFSLPQLIRETVALFQARVLEKDIVIECSIDPAIPMWSFGAEKRLHQVLVNIIGNAVKFTDHGRVTVNATFENERVNLEIADTGVGIPEDKLEAVFAPFTQADSSVARRFGGTGLGLPISKTLTELMGGSLSVRSQPGKGTVFCIVLNLKPPCKPHVDHEHAGELPPLPSQRILLVEDDRTNQEIAKVYLQGKGHVVTTASDGFEALRAYAENLFDVVLMDIQMPILDGIDTTQRLRCWEKENNRLKTPIIALTAHAMKGDRERFIEAGMDGYGSKPFEFTKLLAVIREVTTGTGSMASTLEKTCVEHNPEQTFNPEATIRNETTNKPAMHIPSAPENSTLLDMDAAFRAVKPRIWKIGAQVLMEDTPADINAMLSALDQKDYTKVRHVAHKLKGAAGNVQAVRVMQLAFAIEHACEKKNYPPVHELCPKLEKAWLETAQALKNEVASH